MKAHERFQILVCVSLALGFRAAARAEAEVVKEPDLFDGLNSSAKPVVEVRGETPYVAIDGRLAAVAPEKVKFYASNGPVAVNAAIPPAWVFASQVSALNRPTIPNKAAGGIPFNCELLFSLDLESPTALEDVFIVVTLLSDRGENGVYFHEVGSLHPYKVRTVQIDKTIHGDLGEATVTWHLFAGGREVLHSLMGADEIERSLNLLVFRARRGVRNADAAPYLTFPPRGLPKAPGRATLNLDLSREGAVDHAAMIGAASPRLEQELLDAVGHWRFLPRMADGRAVPASVTATVDLARWKTWSNDCVRVVPPVAPPSP